MADLLIRDLDPALERELETRARAHQRTLSEEALSAIRAGLRAPRRKLGTEMMNLIRPEDRGDDLDFELPPSAPLQPPDFE